MAVPASTSHALVWFREDLRLSDNAALTSAIETGRPVLCLYVHDTQTLGLRNPGAAARWWLAHSLRALADDLSRRGAQLVILEGRTLALMRRILETGSISSLHWTRRHGPEEALDASIANEAVGRGIAVLAHGGRLVLEPPRRAESHPAAARSFTRFHAAAPAEEDAEDAASFHLPSPDSIVAGSFPGGLAAARITAEHIDAVLLRGASRHQALAKYWRPGEVGARERLASFLARIETYAHDRDRPDIDATSRLSPHLRFGEIGPRAILREFQSIPSRRSDGDGRPHGKEPGVRALRAQIGWRDLFHAQRCSSSGLETREVRPVFQNFPWRHDPEGLAAWKSGRTGYPLVDAGMRELLETGFMHNRVRMVAASFLVKHLMIDWREGECWFWERLVDADAANNPGNWQGVAGCGHDALPHQRIFNPVLQAERFDPCGDYVRRYVPELAGLKGRALFAPWQAPPLELAFAGVRIGVDYPRPLVDHDAARRRFLAALNTSFTA